MQTDTMHSEEVVKLNVALRYCDQLKNNLQASILHVQMLNRKYNTIDYTQALSNSFIGSPRKNNSSMQQTKVEPEIRKKQVRTVKDIKHNFNSIIVNGIKLRRVVETTATKLKLLRKEHRMESPYIVKTRLQPTNHSPVSSPSTGCRHSRCFQSSSVSIGCRDASTVNSVRNHSYNGKSMQQTPQRKRTTRLAVNKVAMTPDLNVKKIRFQSTPIKTNTPTSNTTTNGSCLLSDSHTTNNSCSLLNSPKLIADDKISPTINSPIKSCLKIPFSSSHPMHRSSSESTSNASKRELYESPKRICWTSIVKVRRISVYQ